MNDQALATAARLTQTHRVVRLLTDLAAFLGVALPDDAAESITEFVRAVADHAEISVLNDEHTLADAITGLDVRFKSTGLDPVEVAGVLRHVRAEVIEIERAFADFGRGDDDATREHALTEIGDAMLLLARLAMRLGAGPLEPLRLTVRKSAARLRSFELLRGTSDEAPVFLWRMAKRFADPK